MFRSVKLFRINQREMKRILEIIEIGMPQSLIHRDDEPTDELIDTFELMLELNEMLKTNER